MAFLSLSLADDYGRLTRRNIELEPQVLLADYVISAAAIIASLEDVTDLGVVRADLVIEDITAGFAVTAGANVDVGSTFSGYIYGGGGKKASLKVPGIKAALVGGDGSIPLTGVVAAHLAHYLQATPAIALISDGEEIDSWIAGSLDR